MIANFLEDFGPASFVQNSETEPNPDVDEDQLAIFEQGYSAGWEDAFSAQAQNAQLASEAFAKNLSDLSFTYQEASQHMSLALLPFLQALLDSVLPVIIDASLTAQIAAQLVEASNAGEPVVTVVRCAPGRVSLVEQALPVHLDMPVKVVSDQSLSTDAVAIEFDATQKHFDLSEVANHARRAIDAYEFQLNKDGSNG